MLFAQRIKLFDVLANSDALATLPRLLAGAGSDINWPGSSSPIARTLAITAGSTALCVFRSDLEADFFDLAAFAGGIAPVQYG